MAELAKAFEKAAQEEIEERRGPEIKDARRIEKARTWLDEWTETHNMDFTATARAMGLKESGGRSLVSKFVNLKLDVDPTRIVLAVEQYRASIEGPDGISAVIGFRETETVRRINAHLNACREGKKMGALVGYKGYGKTEALKRAQRLSDRDGKPSIRYLTCNVLTHAAFLVRFVAADMGLTGKGGDPAMLLELIARRLRSNAEFWIVDEGTWLQDRCMHVLRYIHDVTATGMVIVGTPYFLSKVTMHADSGPQVDVGRNGKGRLPHDGPLALFADRIFTEVVPGLDEEEAIEIAEDVLKCELADEAVSKLNFYINHSFRLLARMILNLRELRKRKPHLKLDGRAIETAWDMCMHPLKA